MEVLAWLTQPALIRRHRGVGPQFPSPIIHCLLIAGATEYNKYGACGEIETADNWIAQPQPIRPVKKRGNGSIFRNQ